MNRESKQSNDLFYVCSMIENIARITKNTRKDTVNALGLRNIEKLYNLADVYHCENVDKVADEFIEAANIPRGVFDNVAECEYKVPTHWEIGRVYSRLINAISAERENAQHSNTLFEVYNSWITESIDNYNSDMYYSSPDYIFQSYKHGCVI
ncbi:MAG: hypothetical protein FWD35_03680 [Oscillospiraceae bacterium]|nr:hypothetical protein [Oscillospiraceae bacterium]